MLCYAVTWSGIVWCCIACPMLNSAICCDVFNTMLFTWMNIATLNIWYAMLCRAMICMILYCPMLNSAICCVVFNAHNAIHYTKLICTLHYCSWPKLMMLFTTLNSTLLYSTLHIAPHYTSLHSGSVPYHTIRYCRKGCYNVKYERKRCYTIPHDTKSTTRLHYITLY